MLSFVPFCKEHCRWKSRTALIIWHCRPLVPCFALSFRLVHVCVGACGYIYRSRISGVPTGAERKVLEMVVSSRHTVTRHSCRCWRTDLVIAPPGVLISFVLPGDLSVCGRQVM